MHIAYPSEKSEKIPFGSGVKGAYKNIGFLIIPNRYHG